MYQTSYLCYNVNIIPNNLGKNMNLKEKIGQIIKNRRRELKMEQSDLQDYAEVGSTTLSKLEMGKLNITIDNLEKITEVLGLEIIIKVKEKI